VTGDCFSKVANILSTMPSQNPWDDKVASVYALAMTSWRDDVALLATVTALKTREFRPTPAELRNIAMSFVTNLTPMIAAHNIAEIIRKHQVRDRNNHASEPIKALVEACGGWAAMGARDTETNTRLIKEVFDNVMNTVDTSDVLSNPPDIPQLETVRGLLGNGHKALT
jgi:hypothetical protein